MPPSPSTAQTLDFTRERRLPIAASWRRVAWRAALLPLLALGVASWALPLYTLGYLVAGRPPVVPCATSWVGVARRLVRPAPSPGVAAVDRASIVVSLLTRACVQPAFGLAWWLDLLLHGRALSAVVVREPLFELSAARSGSTQLAHYLEDDPDLAGPSTLRAFFPYLWLWRLTDLVASRLPTPDQLQSMYVRSVPPAYLARHEGDINRTDSMDPLFYAFHLVDLLQALGPDTTTRVDPFELTETNRAFWEEDFVAYVDGLLRRSLLRDGAGRRAFVKGHFLPAADALARRYPDATFLTVLRAPEPRVRSVLNFHREQPGEPLAAMPWTWLVDRDVDGELRYNDAERAWYTRPEGPRRVVIVFDDYVRDLPGTLRRVYQECLHREVPEHLPTTHPHRKRSYTVDRSLAELGVDLEAFHQRSAPFVAWMEAARPPPARAAATAG
jgi:hypothetical protein